MKAIYKDTIVAEAAKEDLIYIEGNWYFPPASVSMTYLQKSDTPYTCPWKGVCQFYNVVKESDVSNDAAWSYPQPYPKAFEVVKKDFSGYIAFYKDVIVQE